MSVSFFAEYSDGARYQVVYDSKQRTTFLRTTDGGFMDVPNLVNGAEFVRYDFVYTPPRGLRGCDWSDNIGRLHAHLALLTPPVKPATLIPPQPVEDLRVHIEPGPDSFRRLQEAGAKGELEYRANRQQARQQALNVLNEPNAHKIQEARRVSNEWAALKRPRGRGAYITKGDE